MRGLTNSILELIRARQKLSLKIAEAKRTKGLAVEDKQVEARLINSVREHAKGIGLEEDLAESIAWKLIESSKIAQRKDTYLQQIKEFLKSSKIRSVSIVGAGRMGGWFARYFNMLGANVILYDENRSRGIEKARTLGCKTARSISDAATSDLVILAVPISATPKGIEKLAELAVNKQKVRVVEISSVKNGIARSGLLDESGISRGIKLYSIHPLFGSNANHFSVNNIVQVNRLDSDFVKSLFPHFRVFKMSWKKHDELMGPMLSLPHSLALVFADVLLKKKIPKGLGSPSYDHMLELARKVLSESPGVYFEIQSINPNSRKVINDAIESLRQFNVLTKNEPRFRKFFEQSKRVCDRLNEV